MSMNVSFRDVSITLGSLFGLVVLGQGCASSSGDPGAAEGTGETQSALSQSAPPVHPAAAAAAVCPGTYDNCHKCSSDSCGQPCCSHEMEPGLNTWSVDDCYVYAPPRYVVRAGTAPVLCDMETHVSLGGVSVDIYGATDYQDTSCTHGADAWKKVQLASVHCSLLEAITEKTECGRKVIAKVTELAQAGYVPIVQDTDKDKCPTPRF